MIYKRHYVQFNDLVFDDVEVISEDDASTSFKYEETSYSYYHGAYSPKKTAYGLVNSSSVSLTLRLQMKTLPCEYRRFYRRFAVSQLAVHGRLWAVQDNTLIWAYASISNINESQSSKKDELEIDVAFRLPEGVWHKADKMRTFLVPWDKCDFMECYDFKEVEPCFTGDCCNCASDPQEDCHCCDCNNLTKDMALCYHTEELQKFYECRGAGYRIVYDCDAAHRYFDNYYGKEHLGTKFCTNNGLIAGRLYSDTDLPTRGITITFHGPVKDPYIEINGNGNIVKGEWNGELIINPDGSVMQDSAPGVEINTTVIYSNGCARCNILPVDAWEIPAGNEYGWTVNPGYNRIVIQTGACTCTTCVYIEVDSLTI